MSVQSTSVFRPDLFKGKVLFCTGGGTGICYKMVQQIMAHGANATIIGRRQSVIEESAAKLSKDTGRQCIGLSADVRKIESIEAAVKETINKFGRIDFVINGAAGNFLAPIEGLSANAFKTVIEIDLLGTFNTIKATLPYVKKTKGAYLSISATLHYKATIFQAHPSAAKAGVDALSAVLAVEYGPHGVRSNILAPADTEGFQRLVKEGGEKRVPIQRWGTTDDMANAAIFLFSDAGSYITGERLVVDGGLVHMSYPSAPYPQSVIDTASFRNKASL